MVPYGFRQLRFTFELGEGNFGLSGVNRLTVEGLRAEIQITMPVLARDGSSSSAVMAIYGLTIDEINKLTKAGTQFFGRNNRVLVEASSQGEDETDPWIAIYHGQIYQAYPMMNQQPEPPMVFFAVPGDAAALQLKPVDPITIEGGVTAATVIERAAAQVGYSIENNGVTAQLTNPYLKGSALEQITTALDAVDAYGTVSRTDNRVAIWPRDGNRAGQVAELSPESGMIGYPEFETVKIKVRHIFDPSLVGSVDPGFQFRVKSPLTAANGTWNAITLTLALSCQAPGGGRGAAGGPWEMLIDGYRAP